MLHCWDGIGKVMERCLASSRHIALRMRPNCSILVSSDHRIFLTLTVSIQPKSGLSCVFRLVTLPYSLDGWGVASDGCPSGSFSHLHIGSLKLRQSDHLGSWSPLPWLLSLARWPALGWVLLVPNFHLRIVMEATRFLGTFKTDRNVFVSSPDTMLSRNCADSFWLLVWYALSAVRPYIHRCVPFQNHVQSN